MYNRVTDGAPVFESPAERGSFLSLLREIKRRDQWTSFAWCLMVNHYHLVLVPHSATALARMMKRVNHRLSRSINARYDRTGPAFDSRYYSCPMDEAHAVASFRYVNRNSVRAGLAPEARDYRWSSARYLLGLETVDPLVRTRHPFGMTLDWVDLLRSDPSEVGAIRTSTRRGRRLEKPTPTG